MPCQNDFMVLIYEQKIPKVNERLFPCERTEQLKSLEDIRENKNSCEKVLEIIRMGRKSLEKNADGYETTNRMNRSRKT